MLLYDFYSNDICQVYHICPLMMSGVESPPQSELLQQVCGGKPVLVLGSVLRMSRANNKYQEHSSELR